MTNRVIAILGAGGAGRTICASLKRYLSSTRQEVNVTFFEECADLVGCDVLGCAVKPIASLLSYERARVIVSYSNPGLRKKWVDYCLRHGMSFFEFIDPSHIAYEPHVLGLGSVYLANTLSSVNVRIGSHVQLNIYSYVEHDCIIGDFVTFAPRVSCNGWVVVEDGAYIGAGAVIKDGSFNKPIVIGENAVVGMGAVVTRSVGKNTTVVGNPARVLNNTC